METTLNAVDASYFLWDALWKKDTSSYLSLNILDVVQLTADGAISGWLFTSSQGEVKSKLATNWRLDTMVNRCSYFEKGTIAHHYNVSVRKWMCLTSTDMLASVIGAKNPSRSAVILHPLLNRSTVFMEVDCVKPVYERRIEIPTFTNTWLCDLSAKGMKTKVDSLPTQSIVCKDKESNSLSRDYLTTIIKLLETNLRIKVTHISIVVIFESVPAGPANSTKFGTTVLSSESRIVRLHHISSLTYRAAVQPQSTAGGDSFSTFSDVNSNSVEAASLLSAKPSRVDCCHGDFCLYSAAEEGRNDAAENLEFDENGDFHIQSEALKAVSRHRPVTRNDRFRALAAQAGEEVEDTAEKMDLYPGQTDHLIAASKKEKNTSSSSSFSFNSSSGVLREPNNAYSSDASLRTKGSTFRTQQTLHTQKSKLLQEAVRRTEKKLKVMSKSIALARQEMEELESRDIDHLNSSNDNLSPSSRRKGMNIYCICKIVFLCCFYTQQTVFDFNYSYLLVSSKIFCLL